MALRRGHGNGRGTPRVEVLPIDELPGGVAATSVAAPNGTASAAATALRSSGDTAAAATLGRLGGLAKAARDRGLRVLDGLGLRGVPNETLAPYLADAEAFALSEVRRLAAEVGGGECGPMPSSMVQSAALELAGSRAAFAAGNTLLGSRLAASSRQNLLGAFELCARLAKSRPTDPADDWVSRMCPPRKERA